MRRAQRRDAARQERFFFRRSIYPDLVPHGHSFHTPTESRTHTPQGSGSSSPTSTHAPRTLLNTYGAGRDNDVLPAHIPPAEIVDADQGEYERSSGAQTPEPVKEDVSILTPQARTGTRAHPGRDPPTTAAQSRCPSPSLPTFGAVEDEYEEMSVAEIIGGKGESFPGLLGVVNAYLNTLNVEFAAKKRIRSYLNLIKWRADGRLLPEF
jgi:glutamate--cysteine ligase catalytic subunit